MKKRFLLLIVVLVAGLAVGYFAILKPLLAEYERVANLEVTEINLLSVSDGAYTGSFEYAKRKVVVNVVVKDHLISKVEVVEHDDELETLDAKAFLEDALKDNHSNKVDALSGATTSSKAILKAVEDALTTQSTMTE